MQQLSSHLDQSLPLRRWKRQRLGQQLVKGGLFLRLRFMVFLQWLGKTYTIYNYI